MKYVFIIFILLLVLMYPVSSQELNYSDFKEPDVVVKINDVEYKPSLKDREFVLDKVCEENDRIDITYTIKPKGGKETLVDGRKYTIRTELKNSIIKAYVYYKEGGGLTFSSTPGQDFLDVDVGDWEYGLDKINVTVKGYVPSPESRLEEIKLVWFDVQDAEENCLPLIKVLIINHELFYKCIDNLKKSYEELASILDEYIGKVDVSVFSSYLNCLKNNVSLAEEYYKAGEYVKADERLEFASEWLEKSSTEAKRVEAQYAYDVADKKLRTILNVLGKIDVYITEIEKKEFVNTSTLLAYKVEFKELQSRYETISDELVKAKAYMDEKKYTEAKEKSEECLNKALELESSANTLLDELKSLIVVEETPTSTPSPVPTETGRVELGIDWGFIGMISGIVAGCAIAAVIAIVSVSRYLRRRRFDELK